MLPWADEIRLDIIVVRLVAGCVSAKVVMKGFLPVFLSESVEAYGFLPMYIVLAVYAREC